MAPPFAGQGPSGVPKFLAQGPLVPDVITLLPLSGAEVSESVTRLERVVYDQTSAPVFIAPAVAVQTLVEVVSSIVRRAAIGSFAAFAATSAMAEPVFVPPRVTTAAIAPSDIVKKQQQKVLPEGLAEAVFKPTATPSAFSYQPSDAAWRKQRRILPEGFTAPSYLPVVATPSAFGYQPSDALWIPRRVKPIPLSAYVFAIPVNDLAENYDQLIRPKRKVLPDGFAQPPYPPVSAPPTTIDSALAGTHGSAVVVTSRVVYDQTSTPVFKPVAAVATPANLYQNVDAVWRKQKKVLPEGTVAPVAPPAAALTTTTFAGAYSSSIRVRSRIVYDQTSTPVFKPVTVVATPSDFGYQTVDAAWRKQKKVLPEGFTGPVEPLVPTITSTLAGAFSSTVAVTRRIVYAQTSTPVFRPPAVATPSFLFETIAPPWTAKPNRKAINTDLNGIERPLAVPPPPVATPANFGYQTVEAVWRKQVKALPEGFTRPVEPPVTTALTSTLAGAVSSPVVVTSKVVYDETTTPVFRSSAAAVTSSFAGAYKSAVVIPSRIVYDQTSTPVFQPSAPAPVANAQKDGDPDYWNLPWFNVEGETFSDTLRAKTRLALGEVEKAPPAKAKRQAKKAAKAVREYVEASGALLSDQHLVALDQAVRELNRAASQRRMDDLARQIEETRRQLAYYEAVQQDEEEAIIALML